METRFLGKIIKTLKTYKFVNLNVVDTAAVVENAASL